MTTYTSKLEAAVGQTITRTTDLHLHIEDLHISKSLYFEDLHIEDIEDLHISNSTLSMDWARHNDYLLLRFQPTCTFRAPVDLQQLIPADVLEDDKFYASPEFDRSMAAAERALAEAAPAPAPAPLPLLSASSSGAPCSTSSRSQDPQVRQ
jgi:hypothetical protein